MQKIIPSRIEKEANFRKEDSALRDIQAYAPVPRPSNGPIQSVQPLSDGILRLTLETGGTLDVPLTAHFQEARLCPLREEAVWNSVDTNGRFVHWYRNGLEVVELGWDELVGLALGPRWV